VPSFGSGPCGEPAAVLRMARRESIPLGRLRVSVLMLRDVHSNIYVYEITVIYVQTRDISSVCVGVICVCIYVSERSSSQCRIRCDRRFSGGFPQRCI